MARSKHPKAPDAEEPTTGQSYTLPYPKFLAYLQALGQELEHSGEVTLTVTGGAYVVHLPKRAGKHLLNYAKPHEPDMPDEETGWDKT